MKLLRAWLAGIPAYLWSGWGALASLFLLLAVWEAGSALYGALILPDPLSVFATLGQSLASGAAWPELLSRRAVPCWVWRWRLQRAACSACWRGCR